MKKITAVTLAMLMICLAFSSCNSVSSSSASSSASTSVQSEETSIVTAAGELPIVTEPVTIKIAMPIDARVNDIKTNQETQWVQEQTGVTLEFVELSPTDLETQVNMMMNSGDLPDMFWGYEFSYDALQSYVDAGLVAKLNEYVDKYASDGGYKRFVNEFPVENAEAYVSYNDGEIYAVPSGASMIVVVYGAYGIRIQSEFLTALKMDRPQTLEEYYNYLVAVRDEDVNGNGDKNDEVPITSYVGAESNIFRTFGNAFQYTDTSTYLKVNEGKISFIANNDKFKQMAEFVKKLVDENLLDPASFTQDTASLQARSLGDTVMGSFAVGFSSQMIDTTSTQYLGLVYLPPLEGSDGYRATNMNMPSVKRAMVITTACENPEVAFRLCDFMLTEEAGVASRIGYEGTEWETAATGELGRNGQQAKYKLLKAQEWIQPKTNAFWCTENMNFANIMNFVAEAPTSAIAITVKSLLEGGTLDYDTGEQLPQLLMSSEDAAEYNEIKKLIVDYINENLALFALGDRPMSEWDAFVSEFKGMGVERYIELAQAAYDSINS